MSKNSSTQNAYQLLKSVSSPIRFNMTNDFMFKTVLQRNNHVLIGLIASLLHLKPEDVKTATVTNPIRPGDAFDYTVTLFSPLTIPFQSITYYGFC